MSFFWLGGRPGPRLMTNCSSVSGWVSVIGINYYVMNCRAYPFVQLHRSVCREDFQYLMPSKKPIFPIPSRLGISACNMSNHFFLYKQEKAPTLYLVAIRV